jgi:hypothetical protein
MANALNNTWFSRNIYRRFLERYPTAMEIDQFEDRFEKNFTWAELRDELATGEAFADRVYSAQFDGGGVRKAVEVMFLALLGRLPDLSGRDHYEKMFEKKNGIEEAVREIVRSDEYLRDGYKLIYIECGSCFPEDNELAELVRAKTSYAEVKKLLYAQDRNVESRDFVVGEWSRFQEMLDFLCGQLLSRQHVISHKIGELLPEAMMQDYLEYGKDYYQMLTAVGKEDEGNPSVSEMEAIFLAS